MTEQKAKQAIFWIKNLMPGSFDQLIAEGAVGNESHRIEGDDLAALCTNVKTLMDYFGVPEEFLEGYNYVYEVE